MGHDKRSAMPQPKVPIIVGVGDVRQKSFTPDDAIEPAQLMVQAARRALADTGLNDSLQTQLISAIDSVRIVPTWTWVYKDLPGFVAGELGVQPATKAIGYHGGNQPALQCDEAARAISKGESQAALIAGGEALASLAVCQKAGQMPKSWTPQDPDGDSFALGSKMKKKDDAGSRHSVGLPVHVYPLYENGRRAQQKQTPQQNTRESAVMYAKFDEIASKNEYSWNYDAPVKSAEFIGTATKKNRMICDPYPLLMNAFNSVNLSAACVLTSTEYAEQIGIPKDKWIYVLGGAGTHEKENFWERSHFDHSPALTRSINSALEVSGLSKDEIDFYDFYSCFPIVPKLACDHLGISTTDWQKPISLLGGLTSFGGAGNNYSMHAINAMVRELRNRERGNGLILANGGMLTHQNAICLSSNTRQDGGSYPSSNPLPLDIDDSNLPFTDDANGKATIETYTIQFERSGLPETGHIVGKLLETGQRFLANHGDDSTLKQLADSSSERIGQCGFVRQDESGRNLFYFDSQARL